VPADKILAADARWPADAEGKVKPGTLAIRDGLVFPAVMYDTFRAGAQNDVPILIGYNANEGGYLVGEPLKAGAYIESVQQEYRQLAGRVLELYPASSDEIAARSQLRLLRDNWFGWHVWTWARLQSRTGHGQVYFYNFSHVPQYPPRSPLAALGAAHGFELGNVFAHTELLPTTATARDLQVLQTMSTYWTNFAKTGNPNGPGLPRWPVFTERHQHIMKLGNPIVAGEMAQADLRGLELQDAHTMELRSAGESTRHH
jgi:para-nitrobenzyl esterase